MKQIKICCGLGLFLLALWLPYFASFLPEDIDNAAYWFSFSTTIITIMVCLGAYAITILLNTFDL